MEMGVEKETPISALMVLSEQVARHLPEHLGFKESTEWETSGSTYKLYFDYVCETHCANIVLTIYFLWWILSVTLTQDTKIHTLFFYSQIKIILS